MRIVMVGLRGVPATYGGIEHHVEEIGSRLAERGHHVTVCCRPNYATDGRRRYRGIHLRYLPTIGTKHLDAGVHSLGVGLASIGARADVVHYHGIGPGIAAPLTRLAPRTRVVQTIHGLDHQRAKWGAMARVALTAAERMSRVAPHALIGVSREVLSHYHGVGVSNVVHIPNGVARHAVEPGSAERVRARGLNPGHYALFVGRLVPEKAPDLLIDAFGSVPGPHQLAVVGGSSFTDGYEAHLQRLASSDGRVVLTGYAFGRDLEDLYANAALFVLPSSLEGMPLTLLEAGARQLPLLVSDIEPHREVLGHDAPGRRFFRCGDRSSLVTALRRSLGDQVADRAAAATFGDSLADRYSWDTVTEATEALYEHVCSSRAPIGLPDVYAEALAGSSRSPLGEREAIPA